MPEEFLKVASIVANHFNPNVMQNEEFLALKKDMQLHGPKEIDAILVSPFGCVYTDIKDPADGYVIVDGEHRWTAAKELGWETVRCEVRYIDEEEAKGICYRKNKDRGTIDPLKEAALFKGELDLGLGQKEIAEKFLVDPSTVSHRLSLLKLAPEVVKQVTEMPHGTLTTSHLEAIASLQPPDQKKVIDEEKQQFKNYGSVSTVRNLADQAERIRREREMEANLYKALKTAKFPKCPKCKSPPSKINNQGLPWVDCSKEPWSSEHEWSLETGEPRYKPTYIRESLDRQKKPEISRVIRSNFTVKELSNAFFLSLRGVLPQLESAERISVYGKLDESVFSADFHRSGNNMNISIIHGESRIGITAEAKAYRTGEKTKVDVSDWTPTKEDIQRHIEFIDNAFRNVLLPLPEKKPKRIKGDVPELPGVPTASEKELVVPCLTCANDSENGGDCHREHFGTNESGTAYVCEKKKLLSAQGAEVSV
jgi:ParB/RepB/Spo0J family partition protein